MPEEDSADGFSRHTTTDHVEAFQEGDWWLVRVVGLEANHTQAGTLEGVEGMARSLIALVLDVEEAEVGQIVVT